MWRLKMEGGRASVCSFWWFVAADVRFGVIPDYLYKPRHQSEASSLDLRKAVIKLA